MFIKLKHNFSKPIFTTVSGLDSFAGIGDKGVRHKKVYSPDYEEFYKVIPKRYWDDFYFSLMTINAAVLPHVDSDIKTTINFYLKTDNCRTTFYEQKSEKQADIIEQMEYVNSVYDFDNVREIASFTAKEHEAWLLDVNSIHTVIPEGVIDCRRALALRTNKYNYSQVYDMLIETGNL